MTFLERLLGPTLALDEEEDHRVGVGAGIPMLGLDALSSCVYGPEAALTLLLPLGLLGLDYVMPITSVILILLGILYLSYRQTIAAYPQGGGSYTVARENLGTRFGLLAAASVLVDYILNVAVGISAGIGALVSAVPTLLPHTLTLCLLVLATITVVNLRGIKESGVFFALPTYIFVACLGGVLIVGGGQALASGGHPVPMESPPVLPAATMGATWWLLLRSFASGCTAMTGVEAVSNGVSAFREPRVTNAQRTLTAIIAILAALLFGIAILSKAYGIGATDPDSPSYQSVISLLVAAVSGRGPMYYVTMGAVLCVVCLSANTSFADFPRLCQLLAQDEFLPRVFANRGRRLVYSGGIVVLAGVAGLLLVTFGGITDRLIPLFAVGAFGAFTLSQAGMVQYWRRQGRVVPLLINGIGAVATGLALVAVLVAKFTSGAWITMILIPGILMVCERTRQHYLAVAKEIHCARPIVLTDLEAPVVVVPLKGWTSVSEKALRFALRMSDTIFCVHVGTDHEDTGVDLERDWPRLVEDPARSVGLPVPQLIRLPSPYRALFEPLLRFVDRLKMEYPTRPITVIVPELVETRWYQVLLHNKRATLLKAALLFRGDQRVTVLNVPWYLNQKSELQALEEALLEALVSDG